MPSIADALAQLCARPIAHRGLHACGGIGPVENTIGAALAAIDAGYGIECDIQLAGDGVPMVFHDDLLERLTGATGPFRDRDAAHLANLTLRDGSRIPTLSAFLAAIGGRAPLVIEIKSDGDGDMRLADAALAALRDYAGPVALESFDPAVVTRCGDAHCPVGLVGPAERDGGTSAVPPRCDFVSWNIDELATVSLVHPGRPVTSWTVRSKAQWDVARGRGAQIVFEGFRP